MKNLVNCKPTEFLKQTYRIKKALEKWFEDIHADEIRYRKPVLKVAEKGASIDEIVAIKEENKKAVRKLAMQNFSELFDHAVAEHPDETLTILALLCFVEPEHVDDYPISDYLTAIAEMLGDEAVISFFTSSLRLGQTGTQNA